MVEHLGTIEALLLVAAVLGNVFFVVLAYYRGWVSGNKSGRATRAVLSAGNGKSENAKELPAKLFFDQRMARNYGGPAYVFKDGQILSRSGRPVAHCQEVTVGVGDIADHLHSRQCIRKEGDNDADQERAAGARQRAEHQGPDQDEGG